ncbi:hypothetical protein OUZ56_006002 [Daphnia magna]|uniref:Uncharacterized protein n=1 Tax=Daphnia magna TaxID=35525 RepID=A0ABQ9YUD9_9CRUS|nr:hypothetical protein OUZ56_006002 [Daphnia magna]
MQNKPPEETNQDVSIKINIKELSRLMESGMDYEDASKAANCIVQHVLTNTKRCINSSQKMKHNGQPVLTTSSQPSYLTSTPLHTQPLALSGQSVKISSMYKKQNRDRSGRFDDWLAHLESVLVLGDFEEPRKIIVLRSKLYGEAADEFDNFELENPISAQIYDRVKERLIKLFHSTETRSKQSVEYHNMQREPKRILSRGDHVTYA